MGRTARVKVCGLTRERDLHAAVDAGADALGVITDVPVDTPREVAIDRAATLVSEAPPFVSTVLVTMPDGVEAAVDLVDRVAPDAIQIHGGLDAEQVAELREHVPVAVIRAVDATDPTDARRFDGVADGLLVDSVREDGGGGTGRTHDWNRTREVVREASTPVVHAGGLTPENVGTAIITAKPYAVDVASGVEHSGGEKDHDAVRAFVAAARDASRRVEA